MGAPKVIVNSPSELADFFVGIVGRTLAGSNKIQGAPSVAVPGGSVARAFFPALASSRLDFSHMNVFFSDERALPLDSLESNYHLAHKLWLGPVRLPESNVYPMHTSTRSLDEAASKYEQSLRTVLSAPLDLVLLGVGADGHVASLFPHHPALNEAERWVVPIHDAPKPPPQRLSLTLPLLGQARTLVVAAFGTEKAIVMAEALNNRESTLPVSLALRASPGALVLLDPDAAALLPAP
jgi:6-phosphogluconolactonase